MSNPALRLCLCVLLALFSGALQAQDFFVYDQVSHEPIHGVRATNARSGQLDISDYTGHIHLTEFLTGDSLFVDDFRYKPRWINPSTLSSSYVYLQPKVQSIETAQVTVYGRGEALSELPNKIEIIDASTIRLKNPQTAADVLSASGNVFVQKSQMGGGSPVLRGFEANKVLLIVDGVRMNNAIYRSGHLQNAITLDPHTLQQVEVVFGPSSVAYGSDALGGAIHYRTRNPLLGEERGSNDAAGNLSARISSANQEKTFHADVSVGYTKVGFLTSVTRSSFGALRMGSNRRHGNETWGLLPLYAGRENGEDVLITNEDQDIQYGTGYDQIDFLQKIVLRASNTVRWTANFQYSTSSGVPRFDQLSDIRDGIPRWAEWSYGPQQRLMFSLQSLITDTNKFYNSAIITGAYQRLDESRIKRRFGRSTREVQDEDVWVYSVNADFERNLGSQTHFNYGGEFTHNVVNSTAWGEVLGSREVVDVATRYPNGGSEMTTGAIYFGLKRKLGNKIGLKTGARYTRGKLLANFDDNPFFALPFEQIDFSRGALTGSLGLIYRPDSLWKVAAVIGSGFRIPNVDDFGKVREKDGFALVPTDALSPEFAYNAEITVDRAFFEGKLHAAVTGFYTLLRDAIVQRNATLSGQDSIEVEGTVARIQTNQNASNAYIYGYFAGLTAELGDRWSAYARYNFTYGQDSEGDYPLAHIPPAYGAGGVSYSHDGFQGELFANYNAFKSIDRYAPGSTDNPGDALADGIPSWWTLNVSASYFISRTLQAQVGLENLLDVHYKTFASGLSAPGRNLILGLRASF